jgi:uncharacterized protein YndB with AHSA1/START domain
MPITLKLFAMDQLKIKTSIQISKPAKEVFEAIVDPQKMSNYFIAEGSARMEEGTTVMWEFPEFPAKFPVRVLKVKAPEFLAFEWDAESGEKLQVEMTLTPAPADATVLRITETGMPNNEAGIKWLGGNTEGWANFSACLKAFLEYGINLRKGAFDYMKK